MHASLKYQVSIPSAQISIRRLNLIDLNQSRPKQSLESYSICTGKWSRSNSHSSNSQPIKKIGSEREEHVKSDNSAADLDIFQWGRDGRILSVDELDTKRGPVVSAEFSPGTDWGALWQTGDFESGDVEVEGQGLVLGEDYFGGEIEGAENLKVDKVRWWLCQLILKWEQV